MSVRRHPRDPKKWIVDYYPEGRKGKRVIKVFVGTEEAARQWERELRQTHPFVNPINPRVIDVLDEYMEWLKLHRSERYHEDMDLAFKQIKPILGNYQLSRFTPALINEYKKRRPRPGAGQHENRSGVCAINKELRYFGAFYSWAVKQGYANPLPFRIEKLPYRPALQELAHPIDIDRFLAEITTKSKKPGPQEDAARKRALVLFLYQCGLRWKEARAVRWEKIDWQNETVYLDETKGGDPDICLLTPEIRALIEPLKKEEGWVFENRATGRPWLSMKTVFKAASDRAKIKKIKPHQLRRTGANLMLDATEDIRSVQEFLRHKNINTTVIYLRRNKARVKRAMAKTAFHIEALKAEKNKKD